MPDRDALTETWQRTLAAIPSVIGRLAYLATLRNANTGTYEHFGLAQRAGEALADQVIRHSHIQLFQDWLCFGLEQQKSELEEYLSSQDGDRREIVANWLSLGPYGNWVPSETRDVERRLFYSDLEIVLELIRAEYGVASRDPDS